MRTDLRSTLSILICFVFSLAGYSYEKNSEWTVSSESGSSPVKKDTSGLIKNILLQNPDFFKNYVDSSESFEIQIIYTQINRNKKNKPTFREYSYRLNNKEYFCPASTSKLPVSLLALEKVNKLNKKGIDKYTRMAFDSAYTCQERAQKDTVAPDSILSVAHFIEKIMLVSDNNGYNRLFEFLGQKAINERLWDMGYKKMSIVQRFNGCNADCNRYTNPFAFVDTSGKTLYSQPLVVNEEIYKNPLGKVLKGIGYIREDGVFVNEPRDFTYYNNIPLQDLHDILLKTIFPESFPKRQRFKLTTEDYAFLYKYMSMLPRESEFPKYHDTSRYTDNHKKYLMFGTDSFKYLENNKLRIFNIVGQMGGYLTDCAYIVDFDNKVEFVLVATIYNNQSGIFYVPNYRYKTLGFPFLQELGQAIYKYEKARPKINLPDLSKLEDCIKK